MSHKIDWQTIPYFNRVWNNVTSSRTYDTTYTNSRDYPIDVAIWVASGAGNVGYRILVDGATILYFGSADTAHASGVVTVPAGSTYRLENATDIRSWRELY